MIRQWEIEKYPPLGRCLYCQATEGLTDEHIIPFALLPKGGDWYLPKASCMACADITKRFEGASIGAMFEPIRQQIKLKSRRKKTGYLQIQYFKQNGETFERKVEAIKFPRYCVGVKWPPPSILTDIPNPKFISELVVKAPPGLMDHATATEGYRLARVHPMLFARMLAKIAHTFAVAQYGIYSFLPLALPLILGTSNDPGRFVGGNAVADAMSKVDTDSSKYLHYVQRLDALDKNDVRYFGVSIQLFSCFGMPTYHVIVGRSNGAASEIERLGKTLTVKFKPAPVGGGATHELTLLAL